MPARAAKAQPSSPITFVTRSVMGWLRSPPMGRPYRLRRSRRRPNPTTRSPACTSMIPTSSSWQRTSSLPPAANSRSPTSTGPILSVAICRSRFSGAASRGSIPARTRRFCRPRCLSRPSNSAKARRFAARKRLHFGWASLTADNSRDWRNPWPRAAMANTCSKSLPRKVHGTRSRCGRREAPQGGQSEACSSPHRVASLMKVIATSIPDVLILEPQVFGDARGFLLESWNSRKFCDAVGLDISFVQDNHSRSRRGVLRGLHYQIKQPQGKLVRVVSGCVFDCAVDLRKSSPTFGRWTGTELSGDNHRQLWIPVGFAHGFLVLSDSADFLYKTTDYYAPQHERSIAWNDPAVGIAWPADVEPVLSAKDKAGVPLRDAEVFP